MKKKRRNKTDNETLVMNKTVFTNEKQKKNFLQNL